MNQTERVTVDNHVPGSKFNRLSLTAGLLLSRNLREVIFLLDLQSTPYNLSTHTGMQRTSALIHYNGSVRQSQDVYVTMYIFT
jgi:hypothetical protein